MIINSYWQKSQKLLAPVSLPSTKDCSENITRKNRNGSKIILFYLILANDVISEIEIYVICSETLNISEELKYANHATVMRDTELIGWKIGELCLSFSELGLA